MTSPSSPTLTPTPIPIPDLPPPQPKDPVGTRPVFNLTHMLRQVAAINATLQREREAKKK